MAKLKRTVLVGGLSGSSGPVTFKLTKEGTIVSERSTPTNPNTPAQQAARARFTTAARTFRNFTQAQEEAWSVYANTLEGLDRVTGSNESYSAINAYIKLATKYLQVNPGSTPPVNPPTTAFVGDNFVVTATAGTGKVTFTASGSNSANTKTELLLQPVASRLRNPQRNGYRTKAFVSFGSGNSTFSVNVPPGWYATGYRFVNTKTGQTTEVQPINVSQVTFAVSQGTPAKKKAA